MSTTFIVPDMPRETNAEVVNGTSILVKWESPLNTNGILLGFQVIYQGEKVKLTFTIKKKSYYDCCQQTSEVMTGPFVVNVSATVNMIVLDKLTDGLTYTISVCFHIKLFTLFLTNKDFFYLIFLCRSEDGLLQDLEKNHLL